MPGTGTPVDTGLEFETLEACNSAAFEMATSDVFDEMYSFQCLPRDSGKDLPKVSSINSSDSFPNGAIAQRHGADG